MGIVTLPISLSKEKSVGEEQTQISLVNQYHPANKLILNINTNKVNIKLILRSLCSENRHRPASENSINQLLKIILNDYK